MAKEVQKDTQTAENARGKTEAVQTEAEGKNQKAGPESVYPADEMAANAGALFNTRQECVRSALKAAGKSECTVSEARKIVTEFLKRKVE